MQASYPAFFLSNFNSVQVLRGQLNPGGKNSVFRNILVVSQFSIAIALIVGSGIVIDQVDYLKNTDYGFNKEQLMVLPVQNTPVEKIQTIKNELLSIPGVTKISRSNYVPGGNAAQSSGVFPEGFEANNAFLMTQINIDPDFIDTYEIKIVEGRSFSNDVISDTARSFLINETAVKQLGWDDPLGRKISILAGTSADNIALTCRKNCCRRI